VQEQKTAAAESRLETERRKYQTAEAKLKENLAEREADVTTWKELHDAKTRKHLEQYAEARDWRTKYTGLKRKIVMWTEEEAKSS
jgi:hypothetical protein